MLSTLLSFTTLLSIIVKSQQECVFTGGPNNEYSLNLTVMSEWTMSLENTDYFYFYTPCGNREICTQGNKNTASNVVQYIPGSNQCNYYLSIDHHESPQYDFYLGAWIFKYQDGQICQQTNQPRTTSIYYNCDEELSGDVWFYAAQEFSNCNYALQLKSPLACVPTNQLNAKCQWKYINQQTNITYNLDLSSLKGQVIYATETNKNNNNNNTGYIHYFSPCGNNINCYQQSNPPQVMAMLENEKTGTCDHFLAEWEDGRIQPFYYPDTKHWTFHYFNGEKCPNGNIGQETIRFYCDPSVEKYQVINATYDNDCYWELNIKSQLACQDVEKFKKYNL